MNRILPLLFLCLTISLYAQAQSINGTWSGNLQVPGTELPLILHIKDSANHLSATMDSPHQGAIGLLVSEISFVSPRLHFEIGNGAIVYEGNLINDSIQGTFKQNGMSLPLTLHKGASSEKALVRPQQPKPPFSYKSEDIHFSNKQADIKLAGTLTLPEKGASFPVVVLISGSGPQDRDETILGHKPFWVIADYLTRRGVAVLRYDDRGTAQSGGDFQTATTADFATDAAAAVAYLKSRKDINPKKIGLIGHSEGAIVASMVASKDKGLDFIVLLAGPGFDGADLLVMQNEALGRAGGLSEEQLNKNKKINQEIYQTALQVKNDSEKQEEIKKLLMSSLPEDLPTSKKEEIASANIAPLMTPWMQYFLKNNPTDYLEKVKCPVLALDGTKDLQVPAQQNISAIKKALNKGGNHKLITKIFPGLNHLFQDADTGLPSEYGQIEETFSPTALKFMGDWIVKQVK